MRASTGSRKIPVTSLLFALGMDGEEILSTFYKSITYERAEERLARALRLRTGMKGFKPSIDLIDAETGEVVVEAGKKLTARAARQLAEKGLKALQGRRTRTSSASTSPRISSTRRRGEIYPEAGDEITEKLLKVLRGCRLRRDPGARHRPRQGRRLHPQHARGRQERDARGGAVRHLPRHAPGRAADARTRPRRCSSRCSSIPSATTSRRSAA